MKQQFEKILFSAIQGANSDWLSRVWPTEGFDLRSVGIRAIFSGMGRRLNSQTLSGDEIDSLSKVGVINAARWKLDTVGRIALLVHTQTIFSADKQLKLVRDTYLRGDLKEQAAILQSLPFLSEQERFTELAVDACRTNVVDVFEAIACENLFPARFFPEGNFNQLVLKAIFMGIEVGRIADLETRVTSELKRMALDFASERRVAGRVVPGDIDLLVGMGNQ